ncbi:MAG: chalcone isomerase family protein [Candidatus Paceibacterales bacterium]
MNTIFNILSIVLISGFATASTLKDVTMADEQTVFGKKLFLNGMGLREVEVMHIPIKVYVGGLYLEKKSTDGEAIIASKGVKQVKAQFLRRVAPSDLKRGWKEFFDKVCGKCDNVKDKIEAFNGLLKEVKSGETLNYTFTDKSIELDLNGTKWGSVDSAALVNIFLTGWIGKKPVDTELTEGFLGIAKK